MLCVLLTDDDELAGRARLLLKSQAVPVVVLTSLLALEGFLTSVIPTDLVVDERTASGATAIALLGRHAPSVRVRAIESPRSALVALATLATS